MKKFVKWLKYSCIVLVVSTQLVSSVSAADIDDPYKRNAVPVQGTQQSMQTQQTELVSN